MVSVTGSGTPKKETGILFVILSYSRPSMLLFGKNFIRFRPRIRLTPVRSFPVYCFSSADKGMRVVNVYHVRARTVPIPATRRAPKVSVSSTPEINSCPSVTAVPGSTEATPSSA